MGPRLLDDVSVQSPASTQPNLTIVVADSDGVPIQLRRMEGAMARSYEVAMAKVRTALIAGTQTADYG